jgi:hypothetical protein
VARSSNRDHVRGQIVRSYQFSPVLEAGGLGVIPNPVALFANGGEGSACAFRCSSPYPENIGGWPMPLSLSRAVLLDA